MWATRRDSVRRNRLSEQRDGASGRLDPPLTVVLEGQAWAEMAARPGH